MEPKNFSDLKIIAIEQGIKLSTELPEILGYKTLWGVKCAIKTLKGQEKIKKKLKNFYQNKCENA